jgi:hypothetical protein
MKRMAPDTCNGFLVAKRTVEGSRNLEREEKCVLRHVFDVRVTLESRNCFDLETSSRTGFSVQPQK